MRIHSLTTAVVLTLSLGFHAMAAQHPRADGTNDSMHSLQGTSHQAIHGTGIIKAIDAEAGTVTLAHEPIPALNWLAMTMTFMLQDPALAGGLGSGDAVEFELVPIEGGYAISAIEPKAQ